MRRSRLFLILTSLSTIISRAKADVIFPLAFPFIPYIPAVILSEALAFYALKDRLGIRTSAGRGLMLIVIANIISSLAGLIVPGPYRAEIAIWFLLAYVLSTVIEGLVYHMAIKQGVTKSLSLSAILNAVSYAVVAGSMIRNIF